MRGVSARVPSLPDCAGPLAAHHVVFRSRDRSRTLDVDNGATLCRAHHEWVHAHPEDARRRFLLAGRASDGVVAGRVILHDEEPAELPDPPLLAAVHDINAERERLRALRPRSPQ